MLRFSRPLDLGVLLCTYRAVGGLECQKAHSTVSTSSFSTYSLSVFFVITDFWWITPWVEKHRVVDLSAAPLGINRTFDS